MELADVEISERDCTAVQPRARRHRPLPVHRRAVRGRELRARPPRRRRVRAMRSGGRRLLGGGRSACPRDRLPVHGRRAPAGRADAVRVRRLPLRRCQLPDGATRRRALRHVRARDDGLHRRAARPGSRSVAATALQPISRTRGATTSICAARASRASAVSARCAARHRPRSPRPARARSRHRLRTRRP